MVKVIDNAGTGHRSKNHRTLPTLFQVQTLHDGEWPTPWNTVVLEELISPQLVKKFLAFYGDRGSLPHSQQPASCHYTQPEQSMSPQTTS